MGHHQPVFDGPVPLAVIAPATRRELDSRAKQRFGLTLEGMYATWAYWCRRAGTFRALPWWQRRRVRTAIREADRKAELNLERIRALWNPSVDVVEVADRTGDP
jgi:hypothetical protein